MLKASYNYDFDRIYERIIITAFKHISVFQVTPECIQIA